MFKYDIGIQSSIIESSLIFLVRHEEDSALCVDIFSLEVGEKSSFVIFQVYSESLGKLLLGVLVEEKDF
jgi:hypothetical protein